MTSILVFFFLFFIFIYLHVLPVCLSLMFAACGARGWLWLIVGVCPRLHHWRTGGPTSSAITPLSPTANSTATCRYPRPYGNSWFWLAFTNYKLII